MPTLKPAAASAAQAPVVAEQAVVAEPVVIKTPAEIIKDLCRDSNTVVVDATITSVNATLRVSKKGTNYHQLFLLLDKSVPGFKLVDNVHVQTQLGGVYVGWFQFEALMKKSLFFGKFVTRIFETIEVGYPELLLSGLRVRLLCEFVPAGEERSNPFAVKNPQPYGVSSEDRYMYHLVGVDRPADELTVAAYATVQRDINEDARKAIAVSRAAKAQSASFVKAALASVDADIPDNDVPF